MAGWYVAVAELPRWPSREEMGRILTEAGFRVDVGPYAVRLLDFEEGFSFETYGGDLGDPVLEAASGSLALLTRFTRRVSEALSRAKIPHGFYICVEEGGETVVSLEG